MFSLIPLIIADIMSHPVQYHNILEPQDLKGLYEYVQQSILW